MKSTYINREVADYLVDHTTPPDQLLVDLIEETARLAPQHTSMQISPEQGTLLTLLTRLAAPALAVEVGTFTGYSSICIARGLPPGGRLICFDVSEQWTSVARRYWERAGLAGRIELRLGPAADTLAALPAESAIGFAFIDADKPSYPRYFDLLVERLSPTGVICVDNVLWSGRVADRSDRDRTTEVMRRFNDLVIGDGRVDSVMLGIADGLTLIGRR
jgi:caffeoyl-CoA O-methyltransferase